MKIYRSYTVHAARFIPTLDKDHPCSKMHGHTFKITIELDGPINSNTGLYPLNNSSSNMDIFYYNNFHPKMIHLPPLHIQDQNWENNNQ